MTKTQNPGSSEAPVESYSGFPPTWTPVDVRIRMKVAIQGEIGAFSQQAALQIVARPEIVPCRTFEDAFAALADGDADLAVIPVENTLAGMVTRPIDLMASHGVHAVAETLVRVRLCGPARRCRMPRRSRPTRSLLQCRSFLTRSGRGPLPEHSLAGWRDRP